MPDFHFVTTLQIYFACYWVSLSAFISTTMTSLGNICFTRDNHFNALYADLIVALCIEIRPWLQIVRFFISHLLFCVHLCRM